MQFDVVEPGSEFADTLRDRLLIHRAHPASNGDTNSSEASRRRDCVRETCCRQNRRRAEARLIVAFEYKSQTVVT
jgi:hypothetical protein